LPVIQAQDFAHLTLGKTAGTVLFDGGVFREPSCPSFWRCAQTAGEHVRQFNGDLNHGRAIQSTGEQQPDFTTGLRRRANATCELPGDALQHTVEQTVHKSLFYPYLNADSSYRCPSDQERIQAQGQRRLRPFHYGNSLDQQDLERLQRTIPNVDWP
jgi:hypothetical protein